MHRHPPTGKVSASESDSKDDTKRMNDVTRLDILETYSINSHVRVKILRDSKTSRTFYYLESDDLSEEGAKALEELRKSLPKTLGADSKVPSKSEAYDYLKQKITDHLAESGIVLGDDVVAHLEYLISKDFLGYGKIDAIMKDVNIEDISCDGVGIPIYVYHKKYQHLKTNLSFDDERELDNFIVLLGQKGNKQISVSDPILDASTPEGNRINATYGKEVTSKGGTFTIRLFRRVPFTPIDLVLQKTASPELMAYLWLATEYGKNIIVLGGTGVGKTSTLNAISLFLPPSSKIVSIEDTKEINIPHRNWISAVTRSGVGEGRFVSGKSAGEIDMFDLLVSALRQRPDYVIVGEVRGKEAYNLFQAMTMGQTTLTTVHAESVENMISRLENQPLNIPRTMLTSINCVVKQSVVKLGETVERRITEVSEIVRLDPESNEITFNTVFSWDPNSDRIVFTGESDFLKEVMEEFNRRDEVIGSLAGKKITDYNVLWGYFRRYSLSPEEVRSELADGTRPGRHSIV